MRVPRNFGVDDAALTEFVVPNNLHHARQAEARVLADLARCAYDPDTTFAIKLSLEEALTNAVKHGNRNDAGKCLTVRYHVNAERVVVMVRDEGCGFCPHEVPDPTAEENLERPNGRGLMLMQSYMTKVRFNRAGNEVWMLKLRQPHIRRRRAR